MFKLVGLLVGGGSLWDIKFEMGLFKKLLEWKVFVAICLMHNNHSMQNKKFVGKTH